MAGLKYSSEPAIRNDNNAPHLHETSLDLCEPYKPPTVHSDPGNEDQQPHTYLSGVGRYLFLIDLQFHTSTVNKFQSIFTDTHTHCSYKL